MTTDVTKKFCCHPVYKHPEFIDLDMLGQKT